MSRNASITIPWADGDYTFRLGFGQLVELQEACDAGPYVILDRLRDRVRQPKDDDAVAEDDDDATPLPPKCRVGDISSVIRLGLIGGGTAPAKALKLTRAYVEERPPEENRLYAWAILQVALFGTADEEIGKKKEPTLEGGS